MAKTVFDVLADKISGHMEAHSDSLVGGAATDYAEYKGTCGVIRGLALALREVKDLSRNLREDDDND